MTLETVSLKEAAELAHTNRNYLLKLIQAGRIAASLEQRGETNTKEWRVVRESLDAWAANKGQHANGKRPYKVYLTDERAQELRDQGDDPKLITYKRSRPAPAPEPETEPTRKVRRKKVIEALAEE